MNTAQGHCQPAPPWKAMGRAPGHRTGHLETLPRLDEGNRSGIWEGQTQGASGGWKTFVGLVLGSRKEPEDQHFWLCSLASDQPWPPLLPCLAAPKEQGGDSTVAVMGFFFITLLPGLSVFSQPCFPGCQVSCSIIIGPYFRLGYRAA